MPVVTIVAGPNGSGKSTLTTELQKRGVEFGEYLNADDIALSLFGTPVDVAAAAQAEVRQRRENALAERRSHCFETVMSHPSHIEYMRSARAAGFQTRLFFVATENPTINDARVANRVLHGGHDVPRDRIATRYRRCLDNLPAAVTVCDECLIFDNSSVEYPLRLLAEIRTGQISHAARSESTTLVTPQWWLEILPLLLTPHNSIGQLN